MQIKKISLHPRLAAIGMLLIQGALLGGVGFVETFFGVAVWVVVAALAVFLFIYKLVYYPSTVKRLHHALALLLFDVGLLGYFIFIEALFAWIMLGIIFVILPVGSFLFIPADSTVLSFTVKPLRRWCFLVTVAGFSGFFTALSALFMFQIISLTRVWVLFLGAIAAAGVAMWWWIIYELPRARRFWISAAVLALIFLEFLFVIIIWPLGYLANGFLLTWVWYILFLLFRFYVSPEGLDWKKQKMFLIINGALMVLYIVFFVRWR
jgi:hypothetical protein